MIYIYQLLLKVRLRAEVVLCFERASLFRKERTVYYLEYHHPVTFDGRASKTHGWVLFESKRYLFGLFKWVMFDRGNTPTERFFIARKEDGMPRKG